ncbi:hypothetical protein NPIL_411911 [Nephila pilipes]|uniref:Uncharacterized protein n=1 Tax=Nephila pilipes TaxID=299642 RepID=A0A8X6Q7J5_NEPPI|nr:hypothetical protein NPIL_411911 [Nephila pilipes]
MHVWALRSLASSKWIAFVVKHTNTQMCIFIALTPLPRRGVIKNGPAKSIPPLRNTLPGFTLAAGKSAIICFENSELNLSQVTQCLNSPTNGSFCSCDPILLFHSRVD